MRSASIPSPDGTKLFHVGVGSSSNIAENGVAREGPRPPFTSSIWEAAVASLPAACCNLWAWRGCQTGALDGGKRARRPGRRDASRLSHLGFRDGGFYGWPYCYWERTVDDRVPQEAAAVAKAITPDYAGGTPHRSAFAGCRPAQPPGFPEGWPLGKHGSWNHPAR